MEETMRVLALDLGSSTGWAFTDGEITESGVESFRLPREERGMAGKRFAGFRTWFTNMLHDRDPDAVVYEEAFVMPRGDATKIFFGFIALIQASCYSLDI